MTIATRLFFVLAMVSLTTGCAARNAKGERMSPIEGVSVTGKYFASLWEPGYKNPESVKHTSFIDGMNNTMRSEGFTPAQDISTRNGWRHLGRRSFVDIDAGVSRDYWYRDRYIAWRDERGLPHMQYVESQRLQAAIGIDADARIRGRGINWREKARRENRPRDGMYEGVLRPGSDKKKRR